MREPEVLAGGVAVLEPKPSAGGATVFVDGARLHIPASVVDVNSFRQWTDTDDYPETGNIWWLRGEVWADMSKEQIFTHLLVKQEFFRALGNLVTADDSGILIPDGLLLTNMSADISGNPDATFVSAATLDSSRVNLIEGARGGFTEIEGAPDMVLEVVSDSSVHKDLTVLPAAYWAAAIPEYWVVDARGQPVRFDIFRHGPKGYKRVQTKHAWVKSGVFGKSFRLTETTGAAGRRRFRLEVR